MTTRSVNRTVLALAAALLAFAVRAPRARAQAPSFDSVAWQPLGCAVGDPAGDESPSGVDLVGDPTFAATSFAHDASYFYVRFRVNGDPAGPGGFASYAWNVLMQVPLGNPFQYQYELSLNGKSETIELWANTAAADIDFSPMFNDPAEVQLFSSPVAGGPFARRSVAGDGSAFGGDPDYFVDVAFPVSALVAKGVIATAADLDAALFFPATATNANNYNKGYLACPFSPGATLAIDKSVSPSIVVPNVATPVTYTIAVHNDGPTTARGVVIEDAKLPAYLAAPIVGVSADDASVTWSVVGANPLVVRVPDLPVGKTVTVTLSTNATPTCSSASFDNVATAFATNAPQVSDDALLTVNLAAGSCAGCATDADCDDGDACTADACNGGACVSTADPACTTCAADADCADDGNPCTAESCSAGACVRTTDPACTPCAVDAECDDADACTTDACVAGVCVSTADPACASCASDADCDDGDACTADACVAGRCVSTPTDCGPNPPETCDNGRDDDGDGLVDCHDPDCAGAPGCEGVEVCGDCIDNDGDGLVDYQDPDCCAAPAAMDLRRMMLRPAPKKPNAKRLRLKVRGTGFSPATVDPMHADTTLQISDPDGTVFCERIPSAAWTHRRPRSFRFRDKAGTVAGGLKNARYTMKKSGRVPFRTLGKRVFLGATKGHDVMVTVGLGGQCSSSMAQLRAKGDRMMLP